MSTGSSGVVTSVASTPPVTTPFGIVTTSVLVTTSVISGIYAELGKLLYESNILHISY